MLRRWRLPFQSQRAWQFSAVDYLDLLSGVGVSVDFPAGDALAKLSCAGSAWSLRRGCNPFAAAAFGTQKQPFAPLNPALSILRLPVPIAPKFNGTVLSALLWLGVQKGEKLETRY
jgi:hypothetical protein